MSKSRCFTFKNDLKVLKSFLVDFSNEFVFLFSLRLLQTNSFSGKMNALNEVNKLIMNLNTIQRSTSTRSDEPESLTGEKLIVTVFFFSFRHFVASFSFSSRIGSEKIKFWTSFYAIVFINLNTLKNWRKFFDLLSKNKR